MRLLVYGSKEFSATVKELIRQCDHEVVGMVDDYNLGPGVLGGFDSVIQAYPPSDYGFALAIGYSNLPARWQIWKRICSAGYHTPSLIHPKAYVADTASIGPGCMIMAGAIVDVNAALGEAVVVWPGGCINHDARIGSNTFISPNATICGCSTVGAGSFIGAGAAVADHSTVPESSFVKMLSAYNGRKL